MIGNYVYAFEDDDVRNWRYCPVCGEEILWVIADEGGGHEAIDGFDYDDVANEIVVIISDLERKVGEIT